jgi:4-amino-4-deoxy-L-arabinose transferase-like glycosyltransferase
MHSLVAQLGFLLGHYAFLVALAMVSFLAGHALLCRLTFNSSWERVSLSMGLGLGIISHLLFLLGTLGFLNRWAVLGAVATWLLAFGRGQLAALKSLAPRLNRHLLYAIGPLLLLSVAAAPVLLLPLYPPNAWDATELYLASAKIYVAQHALVVTPYLRFEVYPQLCQMLFALGLLFCDDAAAQLTQFLMLLILLAAVASFAGRTFSRRAGLWAAALLGGSPLLLHLGTIAYLDVGVTLYLSLASYAMAVWLRNRSRSWLLLCAGFCGFAISVKYTAIQVVALLGVIAFALSVVRHRWAQALAFGAVLVAVGAPYYLRNAVLVGNPVFPLLSSVFGSANYSAEDVRTLTWELREHYGVGHSLLALLMLPWSLYASPSSFHAQEPSSPFIFALLPLVLVGAFRNAKIRLLVGWACALTVIWFFNAQILRHFAPVLAVVAVAMGGSLDRLSRRNPFANRLGVNAAVGGVALLLASPGWLYAQKEVRSNGAVPVTARQRDLYLARTHVSYPAYQALNAARGSNYSVYALADTDMAYFSDGLFMGDWFGPARYAPVIGALQDSRALHLQLSKLGATFFLVNQAKYPVVLPDDEFWRSHFRPFYARKGVIVYELLQEPMQYVQGDNLLRNGRFQQLANGWPIGWDRDGKPTVERADDGALSVRATGGIGCPYQEVAVQPGRIYDVGFLALGASKLSQEARVQVNYVGAKGAVIDIDEAVFAVSTESRAYETITVSPVAARTAAVYACTVPGNSVLFKELWMREVAYARLPSNGR